MNAVQHEKEALGQLATRSGGLLVGSFVCGELHCLRSSQDSCVTVHYRGRYVKKPYQVMWKTSGDYRKPNGDWGCRDFYRTRCFSKVESMLEFVRNF